MSAPTLRNVIALWEAVATEVHVSDVKASCGFLVFCPTTSRNTFTWERRDFELTVSSEELFFLRALFGRTRFFLHSIRASRREEALLLTCLYFFFLKKQASEKQGSARSAGSTSACKVEQVTRPVQQLEHTVFIPKSRWISALESVGKL